MRIDFPYAREKSRLIGTIYRPVARVVLNRKYPHYMYIDSGADLTLLPRSVGDLIGLTRKTGEKGESISGVGGASIKVVIRKVWMKIGETSFQPRIGWSISEKVPLLLGRLDVFERFKILFQEKQKRVTFLTPPLLPAPVNVKAGRKWGPEAFLDAGEAIFGE